MADLPQRTAGETGHVNDHNLLHAWLNSPLGFNEGQDILTGHVGFPGGSSLFLRADGSWASPGGAAGSPGFTTAFGHQYVRASGGSDTNDGASPATAKATINAAHTALPTNGGTIFLSEGAHLISSTQTISKRGVKLIGAGKTATRLKANAAGLVGLRWTGSDGYAANFVITDGTNGDWGTSFGWYHTGIWMDGGGQTRLDNIRFDGIGKNQARGLNWANGPAGLRISEDTGVGFGDWCLYSDLFFRDCYRSIAISSGMSGAFIAGASFGCTEEHVYALKQASAPGGNDLGHRFFRFGFTGSASNQFQVRIDHNNISPGPGAYTGGFEFMMTGHEFSGAASGYGAFYVNLTKCRIWNTTYTAVTSTGPMVRFGPVASNNVVGPYVSEGNPIFEVPAGSNLGNPLWRPQDWTGSYTTY
jgi:hypothetical protein